MGCASSSPLLNGQGGGLMGAAKHAVNDVVHAGEEALHDVGGTISDTVQNVTGHVKEAVVGAVQNVGQGLGGGGGVIKKSDPIPMANEESFHRLPNIGTLEQAADNTMADFKKDLTAQRDKFGDDVDKMADDLIRDTEDVLHDTMTEAQNEVNTMKTDMANTVDGARAGASKFATSFIKTPSHSLDSLKTGTPEPELESILNGDTNGMPPSPKATFTDLLNLNGDAAHVPAPATPPPPAAPSEERLAFDWRDLISKQLTVKSDKDVLVTDVQDQTGSATDKDNTVATIADAAINANNAGALAKTIAGPLKPLDDDDIIILSSSDTQNQLQFEAAISREASPTQWEMQADAIIESRVNKMKESQKTRRKDHLLLSGSVDNILKLLEG